MFTVDPKAVVPTILAILRNPAIRAELRALTAPEPPAAALPVVSFDAFAERYGVCVKTVRWWTKNGMPHVKIGRLFRVPLKEACAWVDSGQANRIPKRPRQLAA